mmetsp:Transcript_11269/g.12761  ORF Transcript_11269/g.12761 Transcript_11269/m.12761 type:complete len:330 (-) Transcript_11269:53-1042(-)
MPSFQNSAPGAKSMKFVDALNPFSPFLAQPGDDRPIDDDVSPLTEQIDDRLRLDHQSAVLSGSTEQQQPAYNASYDQTVGHETVQQQYEPTNNKSTYSNAYLKKNYNKNKNKEEDVDGSDDDDDSDCEFDDDDQILEAIRHKRLNELRKAQMKEVENKAKGHGEVRTIAQDEFLSECRSGDYVAVHFFHKEFERCKIMDHHLKKIANQHLSCKFVRIDAEKTPFFVVKLKVQTLPSVIVFKNGKTIDRLLGFEDLIDTTTSSRSNVDIDDFPTSRLGYWLEKTGAIEYEGPDSDDDDDEDEIHRRSRRSASYGTNHHRHQQVRVYDEDI